MLLFPLLLVLVIVIGLVLPKRAWRWVLFRPDDRLAVKVWHLALYFVALAGFYWVISGPLFQIGELSPYLIAGLVALVAIAVAHLRRKRQG